MRGRHRVHLCQAQEWAIRFSHRSILRRTPSGERIMETPIWMPLNVADFITDTQHLEAEEIGAYVNLLMQAWVKGGLLKADQKFLRKVAKVSAHKWRIIGPVVLDF